MALLAARRAATRAVSFVSPPLASHVVVVPAAARVTRSWVSPLVGAPAALTEPSAWTARRWASGGAGGATEPETPTEAGTDKAAAKEAPSAAGAGDAEAAKLKAAQDEVARLKAANAELNGVRLRLLADMENVRMIAKKDVDLAKTYALQSFSKRLLDVVDNLQRAVESVPAEQRGKREGHETLANLYEGVSATYREMMKTLSQHGIEPFGAAGDKFDPHRHEAMMQVPASDTTPADSVSLLLKQGFMLKDRVLRPAQVAVAVKPT
jgi:molecular chaperone GrpE